MWKLHLFGTFRLPENPSSILLHPQRPIPLLTQTLTALHCTDDLLRHCLQELLGAPFTQTVQLICECPVILVMAQMHSSHQTCFKQLHSVCAPRHAAFLPLYYIAFLHFLSSFQKTSANNVGICSNLHGDVWRCFWIRVVLKVYKSYAF